MPLLDIPVCLQFLLHQNHLFWNQQDALKRKGGLLLMVIVTLWAPRFLPGVRRESHATYWRLNWSRFIPRVSRISSTLQWVSQSGNFICGLFEVIVDVGTQIMDVWFLKSNWNFNRVNIFVFLLDLCLVRWTIWWSTLRMDGTSRAG